MDSHQRYVIPDRYSFTLWLFLYFYVLTFTWRTSRHNALARVSKSRTGDSDSVCNSSDKACRIDSEYSTSGGAHLNTFARWLRIHPRPEGNGLLRGFVKS